MSCNCKETRCLKGYCVCFDGGRACGVACGCLDCLNTSTGARAVVAARRRRRSVDSSQRAPVCTCSKTQCQKRYCECFAVSAALARDAPRSVSARGPHRLACRAPTSVDVPGARTAGVAHGARLLLSISKSTCQSRRRCPRLRRRSAAVRCRTFRYGLPKRATRGGTTFAG